MIASRQPRWWIGKILNKAVEYNIASLHESARITPFYIQVSNPLPLSMVLVRDGLYGLFSFASYCLRDELEGDNKPSSSVLGEFLIVFVQTQILL